MVELHQANQFEIASAAPLRSDSEFSVCRVTMAGLPAPLLAISPAAGSADPRLVDRLRHEYAMRGLLEPQWAARPHDLIESGEQITLLLEDPGVPLLESLAGQPWQTNRFLRVAIGITEALERAHARGIVHGDVRPPHIFVDQNSGKAWLTGFGIAWSTDHESRSHEASEVLQGMLAYIAPERTGRTDRPVDSRSDLYALGITFYRLLTGVLPFTASDPMELIHCHLARRPVPPAERDSDACLALSDVTMKLLAKSADERYQTAAGLMQDLQLLRALIERGEDLTEWKPGVREAAATVSVPKRLYGREAALSELVAALQRVESGGGSELVLISGPSGIGKSSVAHELNRVIAGTRSLYTRGKADQRKRDVPYAAVAEAFGGLVRQLLGCSATELSRWQAELAEALGANGELIVALIPELVHIVGTPSPVASLAPTDARNRFLLVFERFVGVFARAAHPLVVFLDDVQWLDGATIDLVQHLVVHTEASRLLVVGAFRDNEVGPGHPLLATLTLAGDRARTIALQSLTRQEVGCLIAEALESRTEHVQPLADVVHAKTDGNPFFTLQFLRTLFDDKLLEFDHQLCSWTWDLQRIDGMGYTENVAELVAKRLDRLPAECRRLLAETACLGCIVKTSLLERLNGIFGEALHAAYDAAARAGVLGQREDSYAFLHDRLHEAAYALIPDSEREGAHLRIGRALAAAAGAPTADDSVFDIVNQLNLGAHLITSPIEREGVARWNLAAGRRSKSSTAYELALRYFDRGVALLPRNSREPELFCELTFQLAECEFLTGAIDSAEARLEELARRTTTLVNRAQIACLRMELETTRGNPKGAIDVASQFFGSLGMTWPEHPTEDDVISEIDAIWQKIDCSRVDELLRLPRMTDPDSSALLDVLCVSHAPANFIDANLLAWILARMVNLSIERGNGEASPLGYVYLGMILGTRFGDSRAAFAFGKLGVELVEQGGLNRYASLVYLNFGNAISPWQQGARASRQVLRRALAAAMGSGQLTFAAYSYTQMVTAALSAGEPLSAVRELAEEALAFVRRTRFSTGQDLLLGHIGLLRALIGETPGVACFDAPSFSEAHFEKRLADEPGASMAACWYWTRKVQAHVIACEELAALRAASSASEHLWTSPGFLIVADYHFFTALALLSCDELWLGKPKADVRSRLDRHVEQIQSWAAKAPAAFGDRLMLLQAEMARVEGRTVDAQQLYESALTAAREGGFLLSEALCHERAARHFGACNLQTSARAHWHDARRCYARWGAHAKVRQLESQHPDLAPLATVNHLGLTKTSGVHQWLDLSSLLKTAQALSEEIELEKLVHKLMAIALEHAGAQRGLLLLAGADSYTVHAEASLEEDGLRLRPCGTLVTSADLPRSILSYVDRTKQYVLLEDASLSNPYSADPFFESVPCRSILCLPLLKQGKMIGALYLENSLTAKAFTPEQMAVLGFLAAQAAISLENARLYEDLRQENAERKRSEEALRQSEERYALAVRAAGDGHTEWIAPTDEMYASPRLLEMLGLPPTLRFSGRADFIAHIDYHPDDRERVLRTMDSFYAGNADRLQFETRIRRDGVTRWLQVTMLCSRDATGRILRSNSAVTDVTERRQAEESLRQSEERFALAVSGANEGIFDWDLRTDEVHVSQRAQELLGLPAGETWRARSEWLRSLHVHGEDLGSLREAIKSLVAGETTACDVEFRVEHSDGTRRWFRQRAIVLRDETGKAYRMVGSFGDVTDRKQAQEDLLRLERRLRQAQRLEAVGTLASGVAHDFNNILGSVLGYGARAFGAVASDTPLARDIERIIAAGERGRALVERIMAFSDNTADVRRAVDVERVVGEALDLLAGKLPDGVKVTFDLRASHPAVMGDPTQVHRVLMNLATNAIQAMPSGGMLRVSLDVQRFLHSRIAVVGSLEPREYVVLVVADDGVGIAAEVLDRIFDPFFTTKDHRSGTGLGLSLVHGIVANMEGAIDVVSAPGEGTVFTVYMPRSAMTAVDPAKASPMLPRGSGQQILLVDDEEPLLVLAGETLEELGYRVRGFNSARAALATFHANPGTFSAVITDERMPGMTGSALVEAIRTVNRTIPIVLMSGYVGGGLTGRARASGVNDILKKPLARHELASSLARVLAQSGEAPSESTAGLPALLLRS